jgi:hypothetical protein
MLTPVYIVGGHMYLYIRDIDYNSVYIVGGHMYLYIRDIHYDHLLYKQS